MRRPEGPIPYSIGLCPCFLDRLDGHAVTTMDPLDAFYQQMDSEQLLKDDGPSLVGDARDILEKTPDARVAGMITTQDSRDAGPLRKVLARLAGRKVTEGLMVGIVPRQAVEALLTAQFGEELWKEVPWQPQQVLPVVVSTRDGFRFGFFGLGERGATEPA